VERFGYNWLTLRGQNQYGMVPRHQAPMSLICIIWNEMFPDGRVAGALWADSPYAVEVGVNPVKSAACRKRLRC
jgi:hypothetical protein